jgi:hypothetical protein
VLASCSLIVDTTGLSTGGDPQGDGGPGTIDAQIDAAGDANDASADRDAATVDPSLVGEWLLDETSGQIARDTSGHGHDGVLTDATWTTMGHAGGALELGPTGVVTIGPSSDFDRAIDASFTIAAWGRPSGALSHSFLCSVSYGAQDTTFGLEAKDDSHINYFSGEFADSGTGPPHVAVSPAPLAVGKWSHIAVVVDKGTNVRMYFDGVPVGSGSADATKRTATQVLLGANNYGSHFVGAIDNIRFYRRALSDADVAADRDR